MSSSGAQPNTRKRKFTTSSEIKGNNSLSNYKPSRQTDARAISTQPSSAAFPTGQLDVAKFVKARQFEVRALEESIKKSKKALSHRAFQNVPRDLRRRTASHNVKRAPKRLRAKVAKEMADDNTPTVNVRTRPKSGKTRLRLETAKRLLMLGEKTRARNEKKKKKMLGADDVIVTKMDIDKPKHTSTAATPIKLRKPKVKKAMIQQPPLPPARFRKRQIHKTWLPTHMFHTKRAHMTPPKEPLWRFAIPLTPTMKSYRPTHRATRERGAVVWDMSYMSTIGLEGAENSIIGLLKAVGVGTAEGESFWQTKRAQRWVSGTRVLDSWVHERQKWPLKSIAPVTMVWCSTRSSENMAGTDSDKQRRKAFLRVHPSAFLQVWEELLKLCTVQKPAVTLEDLRFEIGSVFVSGPGANEALVAALKPWALDEDAVHPDNSPEEIWGLLTPITNPANLPKNALVGMDVSDPRLRHPPRTVKLPESMEQARLLRVLTEWPVDQTTSSSPLFDRKSRLQAAKGLPSQKAINRRKALATPGTFPKLQDTDPKIPILAYPTGGSSASPQGWWVILPWKCVSPVWSCLVHYPLSTGSSPKFGGLREIRQVAYEAGIPWYPGDYPATTAGIAWDSMDSQKRREDWERHPKGKRVEYSTLDLGKAQKGEIGDGWMCAWDHLWCSKPDQPQSLVHIPSKVAKQILSPTSKLSCKGYERGLFTVKITLLSRGVPMECARIYRLPTTNKQLRAEWLSLSQQRKTQDKSLNRSKPPPKPAPDAPPHILRQFLAASLLIAPPQPGDDEYPAIPDETDLVGFVTTGNFNMGEGRATAIASLALDKMTPPHSSSDDGTTLTDEDMNTVHIVIVRNSGQKIGRLARWEIV